MSADEPGDVEGSAVLAWEGYCQPQRYALPRSAPDPVAVGVEVPSWWEARLGDDAGGPDPDYVMPVQDNPRDRHWTSRTAHVPLTLYRGSSTYPGRAGDPDSTVLAAAEVALGQDVDHREPFVNIGLRRYFRERDGAERMDYREVLDLRLSEAADLAQVLSAAVAVARAALE